MTEAGFPLSRADAFQRLQSFLPTAGRAYARLRNKDQGKGRHVHVSRLSPAVRRRLITEAEIIETVLAHHDLASAEKFVSEVFWRSYWKGWLEQRPTLWPDYRAALEREKDRLDASADLRLRHEAAIDACTGIDCFDAWVEELNVTGYLHNWARMQFASIWIFTLGLPWELGAAFLFDRLIDADPASNTLSWRWVAGLHTVGKVYLADAGRIRSMTNGRFSPTGLAHTAIIPTDSLQTPQPAAVRPFARPNPSAPTLLLLTSEDLSPETSQEMCGLPVRAIACIDGCNTWDRMAMADGMERACKAWPEADCLGIVEPAHLLAKAHAAGCSQVTTAFLPVGPVADVLMPLQVEGPTRGVLFTEYMHDWDRRTWPHCRKGFFALREKIPALVRCGRD
ncbi:FAD-binding domain-containing protein [Rhizobium straminoryzae]|uniref:Deoxyribodipyrimidine photolyase n=1 Tax=Rhizobium straminoryzae TaxID=1387186 RepID=A0A549SPF3_9HYPH|nr:FAD-binding domain-containing protein [Rhizobium straminoryzae]TRL31509.1 deoxyribodipyrimidine photolyase [Rhizobium straminoryzae]